METNEDLRESLLGIERQKSNTSDDLIKGLDKLEFVQMDSLNLNLDSILHVEVSGPRWHQDNVMMYSGYYQFGIKSFRSGSSAV